MILVVGWVAARAVAGLVIGALRSARILVDPVVIIGAGAVGESLARALRTHPAYGLEPIGFVDRPGASGSLPRLGDVEDLPALLRELRVRNVLVAFAAPGDHELVTVLRSLPRGVDVSVVPRFFELAHPSDRHHDAIWGVPIRRYVHLRSREHKLVLKRALDLAVAASTLLLLAPAMAVIAVAIKLTDRGPVLFGQRRIGKDGQPFDLLKFRTIPVNEDSEHTWSIARDQRVKPLGRLLRRTSLDELPQLWNVLRGDMSIVGPRPERPVFVERFSAEVRHYGDRHRLPVGLTGWAQIHGLRGDSSITDRAWFDNQYIENWSLWRDITIMARTFVAVGRTAVAGEPVCEGDPESVHVLASERFQR